MLKKTKTRETRTLFSQLGSYKTKQISYMYDNLLCLPYFQGMSKDDITAILDKVTFEFIKFNAEESIYSSGEECRTFSILTRGRMLCSSSAPDSTYKVTEEIEGPYAIEPQSLFGYSNTYKSSYIAKDECTLLVFEKKYLFSEFIKHNIFTINFLNLISLNTQKLRNGIWNYTPKSIEGRIARFIVMRCNSHKGEKQILIKMERLAEIMCETRLNISKALNNMQENGLLELRRKEIIVHSLEKLMNATGLTKR